MGSWEDSGELEGFGLFREVSPIFASDELLIRDRAVVLSQVSAGSFSIGFDAVISGEVRSLLDGSLADRVTILGDVALGGMLSGNRGGVTGVVFEEANVSYPDLPIRTVGAGGAYVEVPHDGFSSLPPGDYGNLVVRSRGTLELSAAGVYSFTSVSFEPDALLDIAGNFDVAIAVDGDIVLGDRFEMSVANQSTLDSNHLFLYSSGSQVRYGHDSVVVGHLEAPFAHVEISDRSIVRGTLRARTLTLGFDTIVGPRAAGF